MKLDMGTKQLVCNPLVSHLGKVKVQVRAKAVTQRDSRSRWEICFILNICDGSAIWIVCKNSLYSTESERYKDFMLQDTNNVSRQQDSFAKELKYSLPKEVIFTYDVQN